MDFRTMTVLTKPSPADVQRRAMARYVQHSYLTCPECLPSCPCDRALELFESHTEALKARPGPQRRYMPRSCHTAMRR